MKIIRRVLPVLPVAALLLCAASLLTGCNQVPSAPCGHHIPHAMRVFAKGVMDYLGAPHSRANIASFNCWAAMENTGASWNPLATTYSSEPGASCHNPTTDGTGCVEDYNTEHHGEQAEAITIQGYSDLNSAFRDGSGVCGGFHGGSFSAWSSGGYTEVC